MRSVLTVGRISKRVRSNSTTKEAASFCGLFQLGRASERLAFEASSALCLLSRIDEPVDILRHIALQHLIFLRLVGAGLRRDDVSPAFFRGVVILRSNLVWIWKLLRKHGGGNVSPSSTTTVCIN